MAKSMREGPGKLTHLRIGKLSMYRLPLAFRAVASRALAELLQPL